MKNKIIIICSAMLLTVGTAQSQSQRLVLFEEFTGENCPPCATQNPALNTLLDNNSSKIISIKYQNGIPFGTPNLYAYNMTDANAAGTYYSNSSDPYGHMDGNSFNGSPSGFTQTAIDNRYNVASPFTIIVNKSFSGAHDTIYLHTVITASQVITGLSQLMARVAVTEKLITGAATFNGETSWSHAMRKMLPDHNGTMLPSNWAVGDSMVINQQWFIAPASGSTTSNPNWLQLEAVAFVQDDASKEVMQAGFSPALVTTGIASLPNHSIDFTIYPNPSNGQINFQLPKLSEPSQLTIYNSLGEKVFAEMVSVEKTGSINLSGIENGTYLLTIQNSNQFINQKLIIKNN